MLLKIHSFEMITTVQKTLWDDMSLSGYAQNFCTIKFNYEGFTFLLIRLFTLKVYALSSDEDDDISVKTGKQSEKISVESDTASDTSDVQATRALIQKLSPAKPAKTVQSRVS